MVVDAWNRAMCHLGMAERYNITARSHEMNKTEMADRLAARTGLSKGAAKDPVDGVFAIIGEALADGEEVRLPGFETFGTRSRPARSGRNPRTGEAVAISASTSPTIKAGKTLKDTVNAVRGHDGATRADRDWERHEQPAYGSRATSIR